VADRALLLGDDECRLLPPGDAPEALSGLHGWRARSARRPGRPAYAGRRPRRRDGALALVRSQQL